MSSIAVTRLEDIRATTHQIRSVDMTPSTKRRALITALGAVIAAIILAGAIVTGVLLGADDGWSPLGRVGSGLPDLLPVSSATAAITPSDSEPHTADHTDPADPTSATPAFDPCDVFQWSDFPDTVQPTTTVEPEPTPPKPDDVFDAACTFMYFSEDTTKRRLFSTFVSVGHEPTMSANPQLHQAEPAEWGGRAGTRKTSTSEHGPVCTGFIPVGESTIGGVSVINTMTPHVDPCTVVDTLLTTLVSRVP